MPALGESRASRASTGVPRCLPGRPFASEASASVTSSEKPLAICLCEAASFLPPPCRLRPFPAPRWQDSRGPVLLV